MRGYLISTARRRVEPIETEEFDELWMCAMIGCAKTRLVKETRGLAVRDALYVAKFARSDLYYIFKGVRWPILGDGLVIGHTVDGDPTSARTSLSTMQKLVSFR